MKNFLAALALTLALASPTASADSVWTAVEKETGYTLEYPVYENDDPNIKEAINADIYTRASGCADSSGQYKDTWFIYELTCETPEYLSFLFTSYHMPEGAVHGMSFVEGIVYDKKTGERLPLSHFARVTLEDLVRLYEQQHVLTPDGRVIPTQLESPLSKPQRVPEDYIITKTGSIHVIFQVYELAPYCYGATRIDVTSLKNNTVRL